MFLCSFHPPLPPIFTLRLYFTILCYRFPLFLHCTRVSSPAPPPQNTPRFNFLPRWKKKKKKICSPMQQLHVSERKKTKIVRGKSRREGRWGLHFDVQWMSLYTLCHFHTKKCKWSPPVLPFLLKISCHPSPPPPLSSSSSLPIWPVSVHFSLRC